MNEKQKPLLMSPNMDLAKQLRKNFTAKRCIEEVLKAIADIAAAIGVEISWTILRVDENKNTDRESLSEAFGRLTTAIGAILTGGKINPISTLYGQDPMQALRERYKRQNK